MFLTASFTLPNCLAAWVMRSGVFTGSPEQMSRLTMRAFVFANVCFALLLVQILSGRWLRRLAWPETTRTPRPIPRFRPLSGRELLALPVIIIAIGLWTVFVYRLMPLVFPRQRYNLFLFLLVLVVPEILCVRLVQGIVRRRARRARMLLRAAWNETAPRTDLALACRCIQFGGLLFLIGTYSMVHSWSFTVSIPAAWAAAIVLQNTSLLAQAMMAGDRAIGPGGPIGFPRPGSTGPDSITR